MAVTHKKLTGTDGSCMKSVTYVSEKETFVWLWGPVPNVVFILGYRASSGEDQMGEEEDGCDGVARILQSSSGTWRKGLRPKAGKVWRFGATHKRSLWLKLMGREKRKMGDA